MDSIAREDLLDDHSIRLIEKRDRQDVLSLVERNEEDDGELARRFVQRYFDQDEAGSSSDDIFVLELNGEVVGVGGYQRCAPDNDRDYWLSLMYIHPYYHGNKLGTHLLDYLVEILRYKKAENLFVGVDAEDPKNQAVRFYEVNGFVEVARPPVMPAEEAEHNHFYHLPLTVSQPDEAARPGG